LHKIIKQFSRHIQLMFKQPVLLKLLLIPEKKAA